MQSDDLKREARLCFRELRKYGWVRECIDQFGPVYMSTDPLRALKELKPHWQINFYTKYPLRGTDVLGDIFAWLPIVAWPPAPGVSTHRQFVFPGTAFGDCSEMLECIGRAYRLSDAVRDRLSKETPATSGKELG